MWNDAKNVLVQDTFTSIPRECLQSRRPRDEEIALADHHLVGEIPLRPVFGEDIALFDVLGPLATREGLVRSLSGPLSRRRTTRQPRTLVTRLHDATFMEE